MHLTFSGHKTRGGGLIYLITTVKTERNAMQTQKEKVLDDSTTADYGESDKYNIVIKGL